MSSTIQFQRVLFGKQTVVKIVKMEQHVKTGSGALSDLNNLDSLVLRRWPAQVDGVNDLERW